ncbi:lactose transport system permease protein LacF [Peptococcaceae bacterium CEB3]|nr:lactose transport system permease protein LacF [Peptococcaceae bacterium CEB3]
MSMRGLRAMSESALGQVTGSRQPGGRVRRRQREQQGVAYLFVAPATLLFLGFIVYGIAYNLYNSFQGQTLYGKTIFVGWLHYASMMHDPIFWKALYNNGIWFVVTVGIQTLLGYVLALLLDLRVLGSRFVKFFKTVIFAPVVLSPVVISLVWGHIYDPYRGLIAGFWHNCPNWLGSPQLALLSVALVNIWQWTGFSMLLCLGALQDIPRELREAAYIDGAGYLQTARYILLPLLKPATATLFILGMIGSLQQFGLVFVMTGGGPANASQVLGTYIYKKAFSEGNFGYGSAMSVALLVLTLVVTVLQLAFFNREQGRA